MSDFSFSGGVGIMGFISPMDTNDTYPVIDPLYGIDGFRNVDLLSDLDVIPSARRRAGMVVGVSGGTAYYKLNQAPWTNSVSDWTLFISGSTTGTTFSSDIVVSLSDGKTMGKYLNGETIPAIGKTAEEVIRDIAIEDIAPTYTPATNVLTKTTATQAEVGTTYVNNTLTSTFTQNDAGLLSLIRIQKNGTDVVPTGTTSPKINTDSGSYVLGNITYIAYCNYASGVTKTFEPSGTPDPRTPQIRSANAPQAAENNFASNTLVLTGLYNIFYGPSSSVPSTSAAVRALPSNRFTNAGNTWNLNTGAVEINFTVAMPATNTLVSVIDLDALNANITSSYILSTFNVNDAGGSPVSYKVYTMTIASPYPSSHAHQITIS